MRLSEIIKEQMGPNMPVGGRNSTQAAKPMRVTKQVGNKVTVADPDKPGIETTIDTTKNNIEDDPKKANQKVIKPQASAKPGTSNNLLGKQVTIQSGGTR